MIETSVLLLHYNKNYELSLVLEAFCIQSVSKEKFEIIVIDDGSENSVKEQISLFKKKGLNVKLFELEHTGNRAACRNLGVSKAKGENLIFLDSDMIPNNIFIEQHVKNIKSGKNIVSLGYRHLLYNFSHEFVIPKDIENHFDVIENMPCVLDERESFIYSHEKLGIDTSNAWYMGYSHNIALKRSLYFSVEGFDSNFQYGWGVEDVEFSFQLYKAGGRFIFDKTIVSYHIYHRNSFKSELYNRNLLYFYYKYKSYEPELFMTQHIQSPLSMCKLYDDVMNGRHLSLILKDDIEKKHNSLFVGFYNTDNIINENQNKLISTNDKNAEYRLIGNMLPYETDTFEKVIVSENYKIFSTEYLYVIIQELLRVGKQVYILESGILKEIDNYWKKRTSFTFNDFINLKKIRVLITPSSVKRQNNVLYTELAKALNKNGYYVSLELAFDELKDQTDIYPISKNDDVINSIYAREFRFFCDSKFTFIDIISNNFTFMDKQILLWWSDKPLYGEYGTRIINERQNFNMKVSRDKNDQFYIMPGIDSQKINNDIKIHFNYKKNGILIIDLFLEHLEIIKEIIAKINEVDKYTPITIITLPNRLDENKIYKNSKFHSLKYMDKKKLNSLREVQETFTKRMNELINYCFINDKVSLYSSTGDLSEIDRFLIKNSDFFDLSSTREFNPYVLQAAAYGLKVYTTSDIYDQYGYENIIPVSYEERNAILDTDIFVDKTWSVKSDILMCRRNIEINNLLEVYKAKKQMKINKDKLATNNRKTDWKKMLENINERILNQF